MKNILFISMLLINACGVPKLRLAEQSCSETDDLTGKCIDRAQNFALASSIEDKLKEKYESIELNCNFRRVISISGLKRTISDDISIDLLTELFKEQGVNHVTFPYVAEIEEDDLTLKLVTTFLIKFEELEIFEGLISDLASNYDLKRSFSFNLEYQSSHFAQYYDELDNLVEEVQLEAYSNTTKTYEISEKELEVTRGVILDHNEEISTFSKCNVEAKAFAAFLSDYRKY